MSNLNNLIVSYDINRPTPTHAEMDKHVRLIPGTKSRILETVWHIHTSWTANQVSAHLDKLLTKNDSQMVVDAKDMVFRNLLVSNDQVKREWNAVPLPAPIMRPTLQPRPAFGTSFLGEQPGIRR